MKTTSEVRSFLQGTARVECSLPTGWVLKTLVYWQRCELVRMELRDGVKEPVELKDRRADPGASSFPVVRGETWCLIDYRQMEGFSRRHGVRVPRGDLVTLGVVVSGASEGSVSFCHGFEPIKGVSNGKESGMPAQRVN